jgi:NADH-quinone oxidoreductase subunit N
MTPTVSDLVPLTVPLMLAVGMLCVFLVDLFNPGGAGKSGGYLTAAVLAVVLGASFFAHPSGPAFGGSYQASDWSLYFQRVFLAAALLAVLGSIDHVARHHEHRQGEYYLLLLSSLLGMLLLPGARDLLLLIVCFELMGIPLYVLSAYAKTEEPREAEKNAPEAGLKLYLVGVVSTATTLFGLSLVFGLAGTTSIARLAHAPASPLLDVGLLLVVAGMGFKIGAVPFHMWVPDTYQGAGTPFVAFLSVAPKLAGFTALASVLLVGFGGDMPAWQPVIVAMSLVSIVGGNLLALAQTNVKRLLAYSGIGHIGYMLMAFAVTGLDGATMLLFYAAAYVVTNVGAFLVVEAVGAGGGDDSIESLAGLSRRSPWLALAMLLFLLSLAGIPFVVGFWAKLYVFVAAWQAGLKLLVVVGAVVAVVSLYYYMQVARAMYMRAPAQGQPPLRPSPALALAVLLCLAGVVGIGVYPAPLLDEAEHAAMPFVTVPAAARVQAANVPVAGEWEP